MERWLENELLDSFDPANVLPVTRAIGDRWAALSARAQEKGIQLAVIDGVVTHNVKDFVGLGVDIINPWESS